MRTANPELQEQRRQQILQAAGVCFAEKGFHQTSMAEIAKAAGLSMGLLYRYFANKDSLVLTFAEVSRAQSVTMFESLATSDRPRQELAAIVDTLLGEVLDPALLRLQMEVMAEACRNAPLMAALRREDQLGRQALLESVEALRKRDLIKPQVPAPALVELLNALFEGLTVRLAMQPDLDRERLRKATLTSVLSLLGASPAL
ncbi:TetR/AcrR family transcriptional regulator [Aquimonas sp.]|jgi:AcrR family transcriptional regulator|uniref:TetR/AcrR family transcriptional regulator n=1 Tax=Aquimonas sp. TaxID=1872588 RepID=UPI0037BE3649